MRHPGLASPRPALVRAGRDTRRGAARPGARPIAWARLPLAPLAALAAALAGLVFLVLLPICGIATLAEGFARACWGVARRAVPPGGRGGMSQD